MVVAIASAASRREAMFLVVATLISVALVALVAFARLTSSPQELRTLRFLTVLLPSAFIFCVMVVLYFIEIDEAVSEAGEHFVATAVISAAAIPFSIYVFRAFNRLRDELAKRARSLQSLHETSMSLAAEVSAPLLDRRIVAGVRGAVTADRSALLLQIEATDHDSLEVDPVGTELSTLETDQMMAVTRSGKPVRISVGEKAFLGVPVKHRGRSVGVMAALRPAGSPFTVEDELLLGMFAVAASAALENVRRLEEVQLLATVEERERIARDLHDDVGQLLGFLTAKIQAAQELVAHGHVDLAQKEMARLEEATRGLGGQVREAILGLRARVGPDRPLRSALEDYVDEFGIQAGLTTEFSAPPGAGSGLPGSTQYQLLRVAQEALSNARRHAKADHVQVRLFEEDGRIELCVTDDGTGFETDLPGAGFGLRTMKERVEAIGGSLVVVSTSGSGTVVTASAPLARD
jgi:signal transduction histidine kinase